MITRYHALLKIGGIACAKAIETGDASRPEFWQTLSIALEDDCPEQSKSAAAVAACIAETDSARTRCVASLNDGGEQ